MLKDVIIANKLYSKMSISNAGLLDEISLKVLKHDAPDFILPMNTMNIDGVTEIRYEILDGTRLSYFNEKMYKREFVVLLKNLLNPYKNCADWFLDYHNLLLDPQYIIMKKTDFSIKYLYVPIKKSLQTEEELMHFFEELLVRIELMDDVGYTLKLLRILRGSSSNLMGVLDAVLKDSVEDRAVGIENHGKEIGIQEHLNGGIAESREGAAPQRESKITHAATSVRTVTEAERVEAIKAEKQERETISTRAGKNREEFGKKDVEGELIKNLFGASEEEEPKKGFFSHKEKQPKEKTAKDKNTKTKMVRGKGLLGGLLKKEEEPSENRQISLEKKETGESRDVRTRDYVQMVHVSQENRYTGGDLTEIDSDSMEEQNSGMLRLRLEDAAGYAMPQLVEIDASKGFVTIGRYDKMGDGACDYNFNAALTFISRTHCRIQVQNGQMEIIDLQSGNGTFVNEQRIVPNAPFSLEKGDVIMFSSKHRVKYRVI